MIYELCLFNALIGLNGCFFDQNGKPFTPCKITDETCMKKAAEKFIIDSAHGIPQYNLKAIDPMLLNGITYDFPQEFGLKHYLQNTNITGMKNIKITKLDLDMKNKRVTLKSNFDFHIVTDLDSIVSGKPTLKTVFAIDGKTEAITDYQFSIEKRETGLEYLIAGEETTTFLFDKTPTYTVDDKILRTMETDPVWAEILNKFYKKSDYVIKYMTSAILEKAFPNVVHNLEEFSKIVPMNIYNNV